MRKPNLKAARGAVTVPLLYIARKLIKLALEEADKHKARKDEMVREVVLPEPVEPEPRPEPESSFEERFFGAARKVGAGENLDCCVFVEKVLEELGYTFDEATHARMNNHFNGPGPDATAPLWGPVIAMDDLGAAVYSGFEEIAELHAINWPNSLFVVQRWYRADGAPVDPGRKYLYERVTKGEIETEGLRGHTFFVWVDADSVPTRVESDRASGFRESPGAFSRNYEQTNNAYFWLARIAGVTT